MIIIKFSSILIRTSENRFYIVKPYFPCTFSMPSVFPSVLLRTKFALNGHETASWFNHTYRYIDDVWSINNSDFEHYPGKMYPDEIEIILVVVSFILLMSIGRDGQLHTSVYDKQDDFDFHISNFLFRPMAILSLSLYETPGIVSIMNVLFWGLDEFAVSYSNKDALRKAWNRHSGSYVINTRILL